MPEENLNFGTDIFISDHSIMVTMAQKILIYGGMVSRTSEAKPEPSSHLFVF